MNTFFGLVAPDGPEEALNFAIAFWAGRGQTLLVRGLLGVRTEIKRLQAIEEREAAIRQVMEALKWE